MYSDTITVYHTENSIDYSRNVYENVHFEENKGIGVSNHGLENVSNGVVIIPTFNREEDVLINEKDIIISGKILNEIAKEYRVSNLQREYKTYTVVAVDDNRKCGLPHWEITVK